MADSPGDTADIGAALIQSPKGELLLHVHAQPGARKTQFCGLHGGALKIKVQAPPVDGKANEEIHDFLCTVLAISRGNVELVRGEKSRAKVFRILSLNRASALAKLSQEMVG